VLYYDSYMRVAGWGLNTANALLPSGHLKPDICKVENFLLHLMTGGQSFIDPFSLPYLPSNRTEVQVCIDYLVSIKLAVEASLQKTFGELYGRMCERIQYRFAAPALWHQSGLDKLREAAKNAFDLKDNLQDNLTFIPQLEAMSVYWARTGILNQLTSVKRDAFIVVNCGKEATDLSSFELFSREPFEVAPCTPRAGYSCG
jgi:hypothetical protein